jgi:acyl carrier protein
MRPKKGAMTISELRIRDALAHLLEIEPGEVSITTNFSDQGIDSLLGLRLSRELQDVFGYEIELEWLFDYPNIQRLSGFLDQRHNPLSTGNPT